MATDVVMPQMGESIAEGTIVRWIKKVGDTVERDEPLFEISTDKVDAEIPSPAAGVITEIRANEGQTVDVNTVVAVIGEAGSKPAAPTAAPQQEHAQAEKPSAPPAPAVRPPAPPVAAQPERRETADVDETPSSSTDEAEGDRLTRSSPLVRK